MNVFLFHCAAVRFFLIFKFGSFPLGQTLVKLTYRQFEQIPFLRWDYIHLSNHKIAVFLSIDFLAGTCALQQHETGES